ncbi:MAG TPA: EAL domain-containing protein, partial [Gammaproteobacteria bacterium]|nr:EAL domain-containing protein [Gammaproteobacteria bacterium]
PVRLRQILVNLLGNAVKFTERGEVKLWVRATAADDHSQTIAFEVSDTGPGIPPGQQARIFEAFSQADGSTTRRHGGTGLGLAISRRLVELMGGRLELESQPGDGAHFRFSIRLASAGPADAALPRPPILQGVRVLIVDDHAVNREIIHNQVVAWGMRNGSTGCGREALEILRQAAAEGQPYRIVLLDRNMPEMDGLELARRIQADPAIPPLQVVILSSATCDIDATTAGQAGIRCHLQKPVRQQQLLDCLCGILGEATPATGQEAAPPTRFSGRVLLAEDNPVNQEVALSMLNVLGCEVDLAENGVQALQACTEHRYDLVLMDCHMPDMDGFSASEQIRRLEQEQGRTAVPIIALTADVQKGIREQCLAAGMNDYLSKPFTQTLLTGVLAKWLQAAPPVIPGDTGPAPQQTAGDTLLDAAALQRLRELGAHSGRDVLTRVASHFLQQAPRDADAMRQALEAQDATGLRRLAHSMKSASATLGATALSQRCAALESNADSGDLTSAAELLATFDDTLSPALSALRALVQDKPPADAMNEDRTPDRECILLIDDDAGFRLATAEALGGAGYRVIEAAGGAEGLELAARHKPDLVLLDAVMDDMDGFAVCRRMQQMTALRNTPILLVTGLDNIEAVDDAYESGASTFVTKPVNYAILLHRIRFQLRASENARRLDEQRQQLASAQRIAGLGYWRWDARQDRLSLSENLETLLGPLPVGRQRTLKDYLGHVHPEDRDYVRDAITGAANGAPLKPLDYRFELPDRPTMIVHQEVGMATDSNHVVLGTVQDITHQRATERRMRQLAYSDELTGLASRAYFHKHLEDVIKAAQRRRERFALLYIDLDGFKDVNDSLGHDIGDELLRKVATRLQEVLRETDFIARLSGDEFCILVDNTNDQYAAADVASRCLAAINRPLSLQGRELRPRCSIGIAHFPEDGEDLQTLLKAADSAMYAAKEQGKHRYAFYQPELTAQAEQRLRMEQDLRQSIDRDQLELHYQPQIDLESGLLVGVEALVRWRHPELGLIPPFRFIDIAERIGLIKSLGNWVMRTACRQAAHWHDQGLPPFRVAVNISPLHFQDPTLADTVIEILRETGLPAERLELEITESGVQTGDDHVDVLERLKGLGISIAIDDFGTGYSSLASLKSLPVDCLKIDRMFITDMLNDASSPILLETIVGTAHALGHVVVAEGVELEDQAYLLRDMGCDRVQGFLFSRPVTADRIPALARTRFLDGEDEAETAADHPLHSIEE